MFCWYPNTMYKKSGRKACLEIYSQDDGATFGWSMVDAGADSKKPTLLDFTVNGKYCKSGLAYPIGDDEGRCAAFKHMEFDSVKLTNSSNPCDPSDQSKKCQLFYEVHPDDSASDVYRAEGSRLYV